METNESGGRGRFTKMGRERDVKIKDGPFKIKGGLVRIKTNRMRQYRHLRV